MDFPRDDVLKAEVPERFGRVRNSGHFCHRKTAVSRLTSPDSVPTGHRSDRLIPAFPHGSAADNRGSR